MIPEFNYECNYDTSTVIALFYCIIFTHIYNGGFVTDFFRGSILPVGSQCSPTGKIEARKKSVTKRLIIYVCNAKQGLLTFVIELFFVLKKSACLCRKQWVEEEKECLIKA